MRREDIANFLTAERKVSPLMAFSLLIVAGFIAGSLQLVAPVPTEQHTMMAMVPEGTENSTKDLETEAPKSCVEAIQQALGKDKGPKATTVSQGDSNSADSCFGGVLADPYHGTPSQNTADYKCVGRSGRVTFTPGSSVTTTEPDKDVAQGKCKIQVCQPITSTTKNPTTGQVTSTSVNENCGPPTQYGGGQTVSPQTGGVPQMPQMPQFPSGGGGGSGGSAGGSSGLGPTPNTVQTQTKPIGGADPYEESKIPTNPDDARRIEELSRPCSESDESCDLDVSKKETSTDTGATVPAGEKNILITPCDNPDACAPVESTDEQAKDPARYQPGTTFGGSGGPKPDETQKKGWLERSYDYVSEKGEELKNWWRRQWGLGPDGASPAAMTAPAEGADPSSMPKDTASDTGGSTGSSCERGGTCLGDERSKQSPDIKGWEDEMRISEDNTIREFGDIKTKVDCSTDPNRCTAAPTSDADKARLEKSGFSCSTYESGPYCERTKPVYSLDNELCKVNPSACKPAGVVTPPPGQKPPTTTIPPGDCPSTKPGCPGYTAPGPATASYTEPPPQQKSWFDQLKDRVTSPQGLSSLLSGLMKGGLGGGSGGGSGTGGTNSKTSGPCPSDPAAYAKYQQQYNYYLQQYNYDLQQYNYQAQQNSNYGYSTYAAPPLPPQPCTPGNTTPNRCPALGAIPDAASCPLGTWRQMTTPASGTVCPVWQCVSANDVTPTAQITCSPSVAEKGMQIAVSYTCGNSKSSTGYGFDTGGTTAGNARVLVNPPVDSSSMNLAVKCENGNMSAGAQCTVQIAKVSISLRAEPKPTRVGDIALIGWVTTGMKSCTITSPDDTAFTDRNHGNAPLSGIATTSPIEGPTDYYLNCITVTGGTREEKVTVESYRPGTVSTLIGGRNNVQRGTNTSITWDFPDAPDVSAVALWLYSVEDKQTVALITGHRSRSGTYEWTLPNEGDGCNTASSLVCATDLIPGRTYKILASLYTPPNATLGEFPDQSLPEPKYLDGPLSASFKVQQ